MTDGSSLDWMRLVSCLTAGLYLCLYGWTRVHFPRTSGEG